MKTYPLWTYERGHYEKWLLVIGTRSYKKAHNAFEETQGYPPQAVVRKTPSRWLTGPLQK